MLLAAALALVGCDGCSQQGQPLAPPSAPPPRGLIAELVVGKPNETWRSLRELVGVASLMLPSDAIAAVAPALFITDEIARERVKANGAWLVAVALENNIPRMAAALPLHKPQRLIDVLTGGRKPTHVAHKTPHHVWLRPSRSRRGMSMAVLDSHLVVANSDTAVTQLGRYLVRNMARRAPPAANLVLAAHGSSNRPLAELLGPLLVQFQDRMPTATRHAKPALVALLGRWHSQLTQAQLTLKITVAALQLKATFSGTKTSHQAPPPGVPLGQLASMHRDAIAGWVVASTAPRRQAVTNAIVGQALARFAFDDTTSAAIRATASSIASAVGNTMWGQLNCDNQASLGLRFDDASKEPLEAAQRKLAARATSKQVAAILKSGRVRLVHEPLPLAGLPPLQRVSLQALQQREGDKQTGQLLFAVPKYAVVAFNRGHRADAVGVLRQLLARSTLDRAEATAELPGLLAAHPAKVHLGVVVDPRRLFGCVRGKRHSERSSAMVFSLLLRHERRQLVARLDVPSDSLRAVIKDAIGR